MTVKSDQSRQDWQVTSQPGDGYKPTPSGQPENAADELKQQAEKTTDQVKAKADEVATKVKEQAGQTADKAVDQVKTMAVDRKDQAADRLGGISQALYAASENLWQQDETVARYAQQAAEQVDRFTGYLHDKSVNDIIADVEDFSQRRPELFLGAAFLLGVAAARFLKSSRPTSEMHEFGAQRRYGAGYEPSYPSADVGASYRAWDESQRQSRM
jgi:hypothetical protein